MTRRVVIATRNRHKLEEFRAIFGGGWQVDGVEILGAVPEVEETGSTFEENARLKALAVARWTDAYVVADDSGLEVDALDGAPGVRSARYAGDAADDAANRAKLLEALERLGVRGRRRSARFRCVLVLAKRNTIVAEVSGVVEGVITPRERGMGGFGYDPLFVPEGECRTFAELSAEVKHGMSHRGRAMRALLPLLERAVGGC